MFDKLIQKQHNKRFGKYIIDKQIGRGRYGVCFTAYDSFGEKVVIKKFRMGRFKKNKDKNSYEVAILSKLKDKRIPEVLDVISRKNSYSLILEHKPGHTLEHLLFKEKLSFTKKDYYNIGIRLIDIIAYLHDNGIVHRDIRIPNVIVNYDEVYLIDFGLARWADDDRYRYDLDFSYLGDLLLYLLYSSFEKISGREKKPWYDELPMTDDQKYFLRRLLGLEVAYCDVHEIGIDFRAFFSN